MAAPSRPLFSKQYPAPFASGLGFYKLFWIFVIGSVLGVILETIWGLLIDHELQMRTSFVFGLFIPVYGLGAVCMTLALEQLHDKKKLWIFLGSVAIGGFVEFAFGAGQELLFGTKSWDYRSTFGQWARYTSPGYAVLWGLLGLMWLKYIYPTMSYWIESIPQRWGKKLTIALLILLVADAAVSCGAVYRMSARHQGHPPANQLELLIDQTFDDDFMDFVYPTMLFCDPMAESGGAYYPAGPGAH